MGKYIFWQQEIHVGNNKIITVNTIKIISNRIMTYWNKRHSWVYMEMVSTDKLKHMGCFTNPFTPRL